MGKNPQPPPRHTEGPADVPAGSAFPSAVEETRPTRSRKQGHARPSQAPREFWDVCCAKGQGISEAERVTGKGAEPGPGKRSRCSEPLTHHAAVAHRKWFFNIFIGV